MAPAARLRRRRRLSAGGGDLERPARVRTPSGAMAAFPSLPHLQPRAVLHAGDLRPVLPPPRPEISIRGPAGVVRLRLADGPVSARGLAAAAPAAPRGPPALPL